jgi:hypothetical protein
MEELPDFATLAKMTSDSSRIKKSDESRFP